MSDSEMGRALGEEHAARKRARKCAVRRWRRAPGVVHGMCICCTRKDVYASTRVHTYAHADLVY